MVSSIIDSKHIVHPSIQTLHNISRGRLQCWSKKEGASGAEHTTFHHYTKTLRFVTKGLEKLTEICATQFVVGPLIDISHEIMYYLKLKVT